jgi:uncharacterized membrane protein YqgA involved in biofilm formation
MIFTGALVDGASIVAGGTLGLFLGKFLPDKWQKAVMGALALFTVALAVPSFLKSESALVPVLSLVIGALLGEWIDIDKRINALGEHLQTRFHVHGGKSLADGFVTCSMFFGIGAMAILGALNSGLSGDHSILFTKSVMDGVGAIFFAAALGIGVPLSGITVLVLEAGVAGLAALISPYLGASVINEISFIGGVMMLGLGLNLLGVTKIKVVNLVPALFLPILLCLFL